MASRNDVTCDVLANVKGDAKLYAEGYDRIFGKKPAPVESVQTEPKTADNDPLTPSESNHE